VIGSKNFWKKSFQLASSLILTTTFMTACTKTVYVTVASTPPSETTARTGEVSSATSTDVSSTTIVKPPVTEYPLTINDYLIEPGADLKFARLVGEDLSNTNLKKANLYGADLSHANLSGADLSQSDMRHTGLSFAKFRNADLANANLFFADLSNADLTGANFTNANLICANLSGAILTGANFTNTYAYEEREYTYVTDGRDCGSDTEQNPVETQSTSIPDPNRTFMVGEIGPGGGTIFYDAGSVQMWGRYLEAACTGWASDCDGSADPKTVWGCDRNYVQSAQDVAIGSGKTNTEAVLLACPNANAASLAIDYSNNGYEDWFLPSKEELALLYTNVGIKGQYWCSTAGDGGVTWYQGYNNGCQYYFGASDGSYYVRPVRAF
jgi:uncharacterized protein YjbI with pentapeptide repeats